MNCHTFSTGLSSGHLGGSVMMRWPVRRGVSTCASRPGRPRGQRGRRVQRPRRSPRGAGSSLRYYTPAGSGLLWAYRTEDVGGGGTLVTRGAWAGAALRPATGDLVLLADASLVGEPDFYRVGVERLRTRDFFQAHGEAFLKFSIAPCACAWWRGRAESLR